MKGTFEVKYLIADSNPFAETEQKKERKKETLVVH